MSLSSFGYPIGFRRSADLVMVMDYHRAVLDSNFRFRISMHIDSIQSESNHCHL